MVNYPSSNPTSPNYLFIASVTATPTANSPSYVTRTYDFLGNGQSFTLEFYDLSTPAAPDHAVAFGYLTSVSVDAVPAAVPEPISAGLLIVGVVGLAAIRRNKAA